jgi:hypothetical protein
MIGIMNSGTDVPSDFFAAIRNTSLYKRKKSRGKISYSTDGHMMIDGKLVEKSSDEMWKNVVANAVAAKLKERFVRMSTAEAADAEAAVAEATKAAQAVRGGQCSSICCENL